MRPFICVIAGMLVVTGCAGNRETAKPDAFLAKHGLDRPTPTAVTYCSAHDCLERQVLSLSGEEWKRIQSAMTPLAQTPKEERENIAQSVGEYEKIAGVAAGTSGDQGRTSLYSHRQLDCIDESLNTTSVLILLMDSGLIKWHSIEGTVGRGQVFDWPHFSTSLRENKSGDIYVVDSWFRDNGRPADVLPYAVWKGGWNPPQVN